MAAKKYIPYNRVDEIDLDDNGVATVHLRNGKTYDLNKQRIDIVPATKWEHDWLSGVLLDIKKEQQLSREEF